MYTINILIVYNKYTYCVQYIVYCIQYGQGV